MGKQSARIYFQGKDHKEIYYQGHYHKAMYIGNQLVWQKITGAIKELDVVSSISYNGVFYVVRQFSDLGAKMRILVGSNLNELVPFDTIENLKQRSSNIVTLIKDVFAIIYPDSANMPVTWHTYLLSERGLDIDTYKENDMPVPTELHQSIGCIISHEQVFFSNYKGNSEFKNLPGFNNNSGYSDDLGDVFKDVFLNDKLVWGISCKLHSDSKMTYIQQYCYSTDEKFNMGKKIISFPSDVVENIKQHLTEQLHKKYDYVNNEIENIEFVTVEYGSDSPHMEYVINGMCYRYVYIKPKVKYNYEAYPNIAYYDRKSKVLLVYRISLSEFKIEDAYIIDLGYNDSLNAYSMLESDNRWNIPYEVLSRHDFELFVLYRVRNYSTSKIDFMYNIKAEGNVIHTIVVPSTLSGTYTCNNGAYMADNYIYINNGYTVTTGEFSKQLRIDTVNNVIEEIERPTVYYIE